MMTAAEYRAKALEALNQADALQDPQWKALYSKRALEWSSLAGTADLREHLEKKVAGSA